jgi:hypothetical protein
MQPFEHNSLTPEAFRGFLEGVQNLQDYLQTNSGERLVDAEEQLNKSLAVDPDFAPARYYKAIVLTHARRAGEAIDLLESLVQDDPQFKAEVLYNLAFAYTRQYEYGSFVKSLALLVEADKYAHYQILGASLIAKRLDLVMLIKAMRAWVMAVFAGRAYGNHDDFEQRRKELLPEAEKLAKSVLADRHLKKLAPAARIAVKVEAHNALGIAYMRMGQYAEQFEKEAAQYWQLSEEQYLAALELHAQDVRVLDNISTLNLIRACYAYRHDGLDEMVFYAFKAVETEAKAISFNPLDRFRWLNLARAYALSGEWEKAAITFDELPRKPGVPMGKEVESLYDAISTLDINPIVNSYFPAVDKSSS